MFFLIGRSVQPTELVASWPLVLAAYGAGLLSRSAVVLGITALQRVVGAPVRRSWIPMLTWGGLRGRLSMVLALGLPAALPQRDMLLTMTFGVVLLSL